MNFLINLLILKITLISTFLPFIRKIVIKLYTRILLTLLGIYSFNYKYRKIKKNQEPNIILSSQSSLIDWLILAYNYTPKFLYIAKSEDNSNDAFIELSTLNILFYGAGIKFPKKIKNGSYFDLDNYFSKKCNEPLVIFPEVTKSNRLAVLDIRSNLMDKIYQKMTGNKINIRSEVIINKNYDFNTTDTVGIKSLFLLCSNLYAQIDIYSQDIKNDIFNDENLEYDSKKYPTKNIYFDFLIQEYLMEPSNRNTVSLNSKDHEKFIEYFKKTNSDYKANYIKNN